MGKKLRDVLNEFNYIDGKDVLPIEYRSYFPDDRTDYFAGMCSWIIGTDVLTSDDGDNYSFDDEIKEYELTTDTMNGYQILTVWV